MTSLFLFCVGLAYFLLSQPLPEEEILTQLKQDFLQDQLVGVDLRTDLESSLFPARNALHIRRQWNKVVQVNEVGADQNGKK